MSKKITKDGKDQSNHPMLDKLDIYIGKVINPVKIQRQ